MRKISKRDTLFFFTGVFAMLVLAIVFDWDEFVNGINAGFNDGSAKTTWEQPKLKYLDSFVFVLTL